MLATNAGLLTPVLGDPSPWTPQRLYTNGEAGLYYEPADLTAEKVAWRRNLLTWSEQFDNAAWAKTAGGTGVAPAVTANAATAPDGTTTADLVVFDRGAGNTLADLSQLAQSPTASVGLSYTQSIWMKAATGADVGKQIAIRSVAGASYGVITLTADWVRYTRTEVAAASSWQIANRGTATADNSVSVLLWGGMLNPGTVAESYQRITNFTSDFLAAFPTHTLYQDVAGTTPVTVLGQPVGLALDKSRGGLANIGATVLANGDFASGTGWTAGTGWSIAAGVATKTAGTASVLSQAVTLTIPGTYRLVYTMTRSAGTLTPRITGGTTVSATARSASGTYTEYVTTVTGNTTFEFSADASFAGTVDDVALQLVPGVHAIQATSASRPALDARVNLLTRTEELNDAAWLKTATGGGTAPVVTPNDAVAPDGTTTADRVVFAAPVSGDDSFLASPSIAAINGTLYRQAIYAKAYAAGDVGKVLVVRGPAIAAYTTVTLTADWQFVAWNETANFTANRSFIVGLRPASGSSSGTVTAHLWGGDLRLATDAAYPYQRVVTATDYADVGVPRSFLFDGFDDSLYTASTLDLSGTDKVTVWAGVYKNSDAARGTVLELTPTIGSNNGAFHMAAPNTIGATLDFLSKGTVSADAVVSTGVAAPVSRVMTGVGDISGDLCVLRLNGVVGDTDTGDQGTGNYSNAVLHIGRRNNTSLPLNGKLYIPVVRGAQTDAATLALTDRYVGSRMGIVL
jgi:hypothetical protein